MDALETTVPRPLSAEELTFLNAAAAYLERPSFLMRAANVVGKPAEALVQALPRRAQNLVADATSAALKEAVDWAVRSLPPPGASRAAAGWPPRLVAWKDKHLHTAMAATTGAVGGFFGLAGVIVEIPATTMLMLRSIAAIAAQHGANLDDPLTRLQCLSVFSFGSPSLEKMESAYFTGRLGISLAMRDAAQFVARHSAREISEAISRGTAPVLIRLLNQIASRFQLVVTQKVAAQAVPIVGAASGALINAAFTDHFNTVARFHFGIVRLEKECGKDVVQTAYQQARAAIAAGQGDMPEGSGTQT